MLKELGKGLLRRAGYEVRRIHSPGGHLRPIGRQDSVLLDLKARGFAPALIFDVGASDGAWTNSVRPIFPAARYVTVEPRQTGVEPTVRAAIGAAEGAGILIDYDTGSTLLPHKADDAALRHKVPLTTLDALAQKFGTPDLVKLDVEGSELEALKGARTLFGRTDLFIVEVALYRFAVNRPMLHEVVAFMADCQYFVYDVAGFIRRPHDGAVGLMDLCFGRRIRGAENEW
jgi:hypothetical protein